MPPRHDKNIDRAFKVHSVLEKEHVLQSDDGSWPGVEQEVDYMLDNFVPIAESLPGSKRDRKSRVTRATNQQEYTELYVNGEHQDELRKVVLKNRWSTGQSIDALAVKSVSFYARLYQMSKNGLYTAVDEGVPNAQLARAVKQETTNIGEIRGLLPVLLDLVENEKIPPAYADDLKVLFRIANFPPEMSMRDQQAALTRARTQLTVHLSHTRLKPDDKIIENTEGLRYIGRIAKGGSVEAIAQLNKGGELDEMEVRRVQALISRGLNVMYGRA